MENSNAKTEAQNAYKKFIKSSKGIFGFNLKKRERLKSFSEIQKEENAYNSVDLGIKEVYLKKIIGSVEKFEDFDSNFIPKNNMIKTRWENIYLACIKDEMLPPVVLYKIKDFYYVYDGNHRISVAKYLNFISIEAEVKEFLPSENKKEEIIYRESMIIEKETGLGDILFSDPVRYKYLKNEIATYIEKIYENNTVSDSESEEKYKQRVKKWTLNIFIPVNNIIMKNNLLKNYRENNIDDIFSFFLEHKYFLSKNFNKDVGYVYSLINFINLIKIGENKNLDSMCRTENRDDWNKLMKIDFLMKREKSIRLEYEKRKKSMINYFMEKIKKLPDRYGNNFSEIIQEEDSVFTYISRYCEIKYKRNIYKIRKPKEAILNYIIEIFIPVTEFLKDEENILMDYERIQKDYFFLLENKEILIAEGKGIKYEDIINNMGSLNILNRISVKKWVVNEKKEELLKNLKNRKKFLKIYDEYGKIKKYKTLKKFFEWLDNMGEKEFLKKLEIEIPQMKNSNKIVRYKTEKVLTELMGEDTFSFLDFYVKNVEIEEGREEKLE